MENKITTVYVPGAEMAQLVRAVHEKGAAFQFTVTGASMKPAVRHNDVVTLSPLGDIPPMPGEVVAAAPAGDTSSRLVLHRVAAVKKGLFTIKGDNLRHPDAHVPLENISGVVTRIERQGKVISWPDRFKHPFKARLFFRFCLIYTRLRFYFMVAFCKKLRKNFC
jgi:signal peptidase I